MSSNTSSNTMPSSNNSSSSNSSHNTSSNAKSSTTVPANLIEKSFLAEVPKNVYSIKRKASAGKQQAAKKAALSNSARLKRLFGKTEEGAPADYYQPLSMAKFNVGGWVDLPYEIRKPVSLCIVYVDKLGEHAIIVEEMEARGASQVLLSGQVEIVASGAIQSINVYCGGIADERVHVVDLHIQKMPMKDEYLALAS